MTSLRYLAAALAVTGMAVVLAPQPAEAELVGLVKRVVSEAYGTPPRLEREEKFPRFPVVQDEVLETGEDSAMLVEFLDKTLLTLGSESRLTIDTMVYDPKSRDGRLVLNLTVGVLRFLSGKMVTAGVTIITPTAIIGIRGSDALIIVKPDGTTTVNVFFGQFSVSNSDGSELASVGPAQSVSVSTAGAVGAVGPGLPSAPSTPQEGSTPGPGGGIEPPGTPGTPEEGVTVGGGDGGEGGGNGGGEPPRRSTTPVKGIIVGGKVVGGGGGWPVDPGAPPGVSPGDPGDPGDPGGGHPNGGNGGGGDPDHFGDHNGDDHNGGGGDHNGNGNGH